jgi:xylulokinase
VTTEYHVSSLPGHVLGVDIGTASSKAVLTTTSGRIIARATRTHDTSLPRPGWVEHDAEATWWADFCSLTRDMITDSGCQVDAVAISGIGPCVLPTDVSGCPLRPAILYGVDTRAVEIGARIQADLGGADAVLQRCGSVISSQAAGPKLVWIAEHEPTVWANTRRFFMAHNFLVHRLTGAYTLDHQSASQCVPLYDPHHEHWDTTLVESLTPGHELPDLAWPSDVAGHITNLAAHATGLPAGIPVAVGTIDAWAEAESVDVRDPGDLMLMYGSTMFFIGVTDHPVRAPALWSTKGNHQGQSTLAAGMASSGSITQWFRDLNGDSDFDALVAAAARSPAGANGLLTLPYFAGERTPIADPQARGAIAGLTLTHTRGDLYRSLLEGIAFGVHHNLSAYTSIGASPTGLSPSAAAPPTHCGRRSSPTSPAKAKTFPRNASAPPTATPASPR